MKQGTVDIKSIIKKFSSTPLKGDDLETLYVDTIEARMGTSLISPMNDIFEDCTAGNPNFIHLLLGHRGCGKSTELNKLEEKFKREGFAVRKIDCQAETNFANLEVEDILILISNALLDICNEKGIDIGKNDIETLKFFFAEIEKEYKTQHSENVGADAGIGLDFSKVFSFVAKTKAQIMNTSEEIVVIRERVTKCIAQWNECIDNIIEKIKERDNQRCPIIIFENFDKMRPVDKAIKIFESGYLENIRTYIIYTFPISLSYSEKFDAIMQYASPHFFPMIDIKTKAGEKKDTGYNTIKEIINRRTEKPDLFEDEAINTLIEKTGGSLRDVFTCIEKALRYTERQSKEVVSIKEVALALQNEKSNILSRRITTQDYPALNEIHRNKAEIQNRNEMLRFLEAHVVLEYNGERWHDLHPLICDFLKENNQLEENGRTE